MTSETMAHDLRSRIIRAHKKEARPVNYLALDAAVRDAVAVWQGRGFYHVGGTVNWYEYAVEVAWDVYMEVLRGSDPAKQGAVYIGRSY